MPSQDGVYIKALDSIMEVTHERVSRWKQGAAGRHSRHRLDDVAASSGVLADAGRHGRLGEPMRVLSSVISVNEDQPDRIIEILHRHFEDLDGARIAILGLAFKPETDDMRESPVIPVVRRLQSRGAKIRTYDPIATAEAIKIFGHENIEYVDSLATAVAETDAIVLMTRWQEFMRLPELINGRSPAPLVVNYT